MIQDNIKIALQSVYKQELVAFDYFLGTLRLSFRSKENASKAVSLLKAQGLMEVDSFGRTVTVKP